MFKQKKAFTLIELLVVTTIIILLSASGVFYFNDFISNLELKTEILKVKNYIKDYDDKIKNRNLVDYEIYFKKNSFGYYDYENIFDIDVNQKINSISFETGNGNVKTTGNTGEVWEINLSSNNNFILKDYLSDNGAFNYNFTGSLSYNIFSKVGGKTINNINLNYFSKDNIIKLVEINTNLNKSGTSYLNLNIRNIGGNKNFYNNSTKLSISKIFLFFESINGKQEILEIKK